MSMTTLPTSKLVEKSFRVSCPCIVSVSCCSQKKANKWCEYDLVYLPRRDNTITNEQQHRAHLAERTMLKRRFELLTMNAK
jgi:hypothetical protein